jgi:hypothetical protein
MPFFKEQFGESISARRHSDCPTHARDDAHPPLTIANTPQTFDFFLSPLAKNGISWSCSSLPGSNKAEISQRRFQRRRRSQATFSSGPSQLILARSHLDTLYDHLSLLTMMMLLWWWWLLLLSPMTKRQTSSLTVFKMGTALQVTFHYKLLKNEN